MPPSRFHRIKNSFFGLPGLLGLIAILALAHILAASWTSSLTLDEPFHLAWNNRLYDEAITERASVYNYISTTPALLPNLALSRWLQSVIEIEGASYLFWDRLFNIFWFFVLASSVFQITRLIAGARGAFLATTGLLLDPNILAHSSVATVDIAFTAATFLLLLSFVMFLRQKSLRNIAFLAFSAALCLLIKLHALIVFATLCFFPLTWKSIPKPSLRLMRSWILMVILSAVFSCVVISIGYLFIGVGVPIGEIKFYHPIFQWIGETFSRIPLPLPADFLTGIDQCLVASKRDSWNVVHMGQWHPQGVWYYFISTWAVKTPLLLIVAQVVGLWIGFSSRFFFRNPLARFLLCVGLFHAIYFSFFFRTQVGYRYILPALPILYILAGSALARLRRTQLTVSFGLLVCLFSVAEALPYFSNPLAFTNVLLQPKKDVYRVLADSNIDWGQDRWRVHELLKEAGHSDSKVDPVHILPGHNTFDLNILVGVFWNFDQHKWVRENLETSGHYRHTYLWYDVSDEQFDAFLKANRTLTPENTKIPVCERFGVEELRTLPLRGAIRTPKRLCIEATEVSTVRVFASSGRFEFGPREASGKCRFDALEREKEVWWRLEPGRYEFCVRSSGNGAIAAEQMSGSVAGILR